ncbi:unnamed protein product [Phaedon cochleariae]|uniref:USP domain-containing protein n=1 Tax=Phaedon cochleariae TaxID=80249 RepID=A0A9N9SGZ0_PHACE|nr:unnamed protein product [Phaedon cochleariae]
MYTKSLPIQRFPEILFIYLKRFSLDRFVEKLNVFLEFRQTRYESLYAADGSVPFQYDLYAISNYSGTINSGHSIQPIANIRTRTPDTNSTIVVFQKFHQI